MSVGPPQSGELKDVGPSWLSRARGSFQRAAESISSAVQNTDLTDPEACRILNDRIMKVSWDEFTHKHSFSFKTDNVCNKKKKKDRQKGVCNLNVCSSSPQVEHCLLSPYVSPVETPFRHLVFGRGSHTLASIAASADMEELRTQLALATWNLQSCSNTMMGNIWELDNEI